MKNFCLRTSRRICGMAVAGCLILFAQSADARQWKIDGVPVQAIMKDFNGTHVLLESESGRRHTIAVQRLSSDDLSYLKELLEVRRAASDIRTQEAAVGLERKRLALEFEKFRSRFDKVWMVQFRALNGQPFYRYYRGSHSAQAWDAARAEFPMARILFVKKVYGGRR